MTRITDEIADQAIAWLARQDEMTPADWHRFIDWLEADPRHGEAYDRLVMADHALREDTPATTRALPVPANDHGAPAWHRARWIGGAAACAAAAGAFLMLRPAAPDIYALETKPGETRNVALDEGSRVEVAGGSRLLLDRNNPRLVTLERGDALFHVRHDESRPFTVRSGRLEVRDVGTVFNVTRDGTAFSVQVAEGAVLFQPQGEAVTLNAGASISVREDRKELRVGRVDTAMVGGWRSGRFAFADTPVAQVLHIVERRYGTRLIANDGLSSRTVTGIITLSGEAKRDVPYIASMIGASWRADGERWILAPLERARP